MSQLPIMHMLIHCTFVLRLGQSAMQTYATSGKCVLLLQVMSMPTDLTICFCPSMKQTKEAVCGMPAHDQVHECWRQPTS